MPRKMESLVIVRTEQPHHIANVANLSLGGKICHHLHCLWPAYFVTSPSSYATLCTLVKWEIFGPKCDQKFVAEFTSACGMSTTATKHLIFYHVFSPVVLNTINPPITFGVNLTPFNV